MIPFDLFNTYQVFSSIFFKDFCFSLAESMMLENFKGCDDCRRFETFWKLYLDMAREEEYTEEMVMVFLLRFLDDSESKAIVNNILWSANWEITLREFTILLSRKITSMADIARAIELGKQNFPQFFDHPDIYDRNLKVAKAWNNRHMSIFTERYLKNVEKTKEIPKKKQKRLTHFFQATWATTFSLITWLATVFPSDSQHYRIYNIINECDAPTTGRRKEKTEDEIAAAKAKKSEYSKLYYQKKKAEKQKEINNKNDAKVAGQKEVKSQNNKQNYQMKKAANEKQNAKPQKTDADIAAQKAKITEANKKSYEKRKAAKVKDKDDAETVSTSNLKPLSINSVGKQAEKMNEPISSNSSIFSKIVDKSKRVVKAVIDLLPPVQNRVLNETIDAFGDEVDQPQQNFVIPEVDYLGDIEFNNPTLLDVPENQWVCTLQVRCLFAGIISFATRYFTPWQSITLLDYIILDFLERVPSPPPRNFFRINRVENPHLILMPWLFRGHWRLLSIDAHANTATLYDSFFRGYMNCEPDKVVHFNDLIDRLETLIYALQECGVLAEGTVLDMADATTYNFQLDGISCGIHIFVMVEKIIFNGASQRLNPFFIGRERERAYTLLRDLQALNGIVDVWPDPVQPLNNVVSIQPNPVNPQVKNPPKRAYKRKINMTMEDSKIHEDKIKEVHRLRDNARNEENRKKRYFMNCEKEHPGYGCGAIPLRHIIEYHDLGGFIYPCQYCSALLLKHEFLSISRPCCAKGKVDLSERFNIRQNPPEVMFSLCDPDHPLGKSYLKCPLKYNNEFAFASLVIGMEPSPLHGPVVCRLNGEMKINLSDLYCKEHQQPMYGQLYTMSGQESILARERRLGDQLDPNVIRILDVMIRQHHALAHLYQRANEIYQEAKEKAETEGKEIPKFYLSLLNNREAHAIKNLADPNIHLHQTELPTTEQVAVMWMSDVGEPPKTIGAILKARQGGTVKLQELDPNVDPTVFPIMAPYGDQGYRLGISLTTNKKPVSEPDIAPININHKDKIELNESSTNSKVSSDDEVINPCEINKPDVLSYCEESMDVKENNIVASFSNEMHILDELIIPNENDIEPVFDSQKPEDIKEVNVLASDPTNGNNELINGYENTQSNVLTDSNKAMDIENANVIRLPSNENLNFDEPIDKNENHNINASNYDEEEEVFMDEANVLAPDPNEGLYCDEPPVNKENYDENQENYNMEPSSKKAKVSNPRKFVSIRQYYLYMFQMRGDIKKFHWLWSHRTLAQKYAIVSLNRVEHHEITWMKKVQDNLRATRPQELQDALRRGLNPGETLGRIYMLTKNVRGSRADMQHAYANAARINREFGYYTFFLTFTGNPKWPEIQNALMPGQTFADRPDICLRVFRGKLDELKKDVFQRGILGKCVSWLYSIEWQKRSMLHAHILITIASPEEGFGSDFVNKYICAEIPPLPSVDDKSPEADQQRRLRSTVTSMNMHDCNNACQVDGKCTKRFPQEFSQQTILSQSTYTQYKRRPPLPENELHPDDNVNNYGETFLKVVKSGAAIRLDNRHVVAFNPFISLKYNCHANLEFIGSQHCHEYTLKYVFKGGDMAYVRFENNNEVDYDEIDQYRKMRYQTAMEAGWRLYGHEIYDMSHQIYVQYIHMPNESVIIFEEGHEEEAGQPKRIEKAKKTMLTEFFELCARDPEARQYQYDQIARYYWFNKNTKTWVKRKYNDEKVLVRIGSVNPKNMNLVALRHLLLATAGPTSFESLKTVDGNVYDTFHAAATARGLFENNDIWKQYLDDIIGEKIVSRRLRKYFAMMLVYCQPPQPEFLFNYIIHSLAPHRPGWTLADQKEFALQRIQYLLMEFKTNCNQVGLPNPRNFNFNEIEISENEVNGPDGNGGTVLSDDPSSRVNRYNYAQRLKQNLNGEQSEINGNIMDAVNGINPQKLHMVWGSGGTGKTTVFKTIIAQLAAEGKTYVVTATTGIAALLMPGGTTIHNAFRINNDVDEESTPNIHFESAYAQKFRDASIIFIDEVSMLHKVVFEFVDKTLRSLYTLQSPERYMPFANKVIILSGDFRQLPPVVPNGGRGGTFQASVKNSPLFPHFQSHVLRQNMRVDPNELSFVQWLDEVGQGNQMILNSAAIPINPQIMVRTLTSLIDFCFPPEVLNNPTQHFEAMLTSAILCPTNLNTFYVNEKILDKLPGDVKVFTSIDKNLETEERATMRNLHVHAADTDMENIHSLTPTGLPPHKLKLKVGAKVMLIKNLSLKEGLCNGTVLQIVRWTDTFLCCRKIDNNGSLGTIVFIPKIKFEYGNNRSHRGPRFTRIQFPVRLAFAMTINKSQGQTLTKVGIDLHQQQVFTHGQLYVALSRVRREQDIRILSNAEEPNTVINCVFKEYL